MNIQKTKDYDSFKSIVSNREVDKKHVKKLVASIKRKNLMIIRPMVVNSKLEVIDGQHRLEACKQLKEPVYFVKLDDLDKEDIALLNTCQKNWAMIDFINFYTIEGRKDFKTFARLLNEYSDIKVTTLMKMCGNSRNVRQGDIDISNINRARQVACWISQLSRKFPFTLTRDFIFALDDECKNEEKFDRFIQLVNRDRECLRKCDSRSEYRKLINSLLK